MQLRLTLPLTYVLAPFLLLSVGLVLVNGNDNLRVAYEWKQIDFKYINDEQKRLYLGEGEESETAVPFGLEVFRNRLFLTFPRWRKGVAASLAYLDLNGKQKSTEIR